jgi:hypothetical protein
LSTIKGIIDSVKGAIDGVIGGIQSAMSWVSDLWGKITGAASAAASIPAVPGGTSVQGFTAAPSLARTLAAPRAAPAAAGGAPIVLTVNGALDPDAVARQIQAILTGRGRRGGGIVL